MSFERPKLHPDSLERLLPDLRLSMQSALAKHGHGATVSTHEALGDVTEEHDELKDAVRSNDLSEVRKELLDIAVSALWSIASLDAGFMDH